jgi:hypothetical protein
MTYALYPLNSVFFLLTHNNINFLLIFNSFSLDVCQKFYIAIYSLYTIIFPFPELGRNIRHCATN